MDTNEKELKKIIERLERLEHAIFDSEMKPMAQKPSSKGLSLPELIRNKSLENGQQKVAVLVGYMEKMENKTSIVMGDIKEAWRRAKFDKAFANILVTRAVKEGLISDYGNDGNYVLTQTGERFWEEFVAFT